MTITKKHLCVTIAKWEMAGNANSVAENVMKIMGDALTQIVTQWIFKE